jgi:16S rRNA (adenine1518-N6/adenine1519-N6)-dimethyltransferase
VIQADILKIELAGELAQRYPGKWKVVANLPYNISSQVLFRLLDIRDSFSLLLLMLQKEVGDRLVAVPSTKEYGILSVFFQLYFDIHREILVRPGSFYPVPKVDSVVLSFTPLPVPREDVGDYQVFRKIVRAAFGQRRKTLWNCLKSLTPDVSTPKLTDLFLNAGVDPIRRGETLSLHEFAKLSRMFADIERL